MSTASRICVVELSLALLTKTVTLQFRWCLLVMISLGHFFHERCLGVFDFVLATKYSATFLDEVLVFISRFASIICAFIVCSDVVMTLRKSSGVRSRLTRNFSNVLFKRHCESAGSVFVLCVA